DPVELACAVVRYDDGRGAMIDGESGVLRREDPLENEGQVGPCGDRRDVVPGKGRLLRVPDRRGGAGPGAPIGPSREVAERNLQPEAMPPVSLADTEHGQVDGQDDRSVARCGGPLG